MQTNSSKQLSTPTPLVVHQLALSALFEVLGNALTALRRPARRNLAVDVALQIEAALAATRKVL
jgi:hypothetical protein